MGFCCRKNNKFYISYCFYAFTSTGFIAKMNKPSIFYDSTNWININDPSSLGLDVINNKENLDEWVKNLC